MRPARVAVDCRYLMSFKARQGVDFGKRSADYGEHRPGFPDSFYERIARFVSLEGAEALDVGTGPGIVALELARRGARVTGVDVAANQIAVARQRAHRQGLAGRCEFLVRSVEDTGLEPARFDVATAGQCWIWFDEPAAIAELLRVVKPGGVLVVAHYCYLARHSAVAAATEELVLQYNPTWTKAGGTGLYPQQVDALVLGGFELIEQFCYDHDRMFSHESWRGRMRTCNGVGSGTLSDAEVARFDAELAELLRRQDLGDPFAVRHRIWATVVRRP